MRFPQADDVVYVQVWQHVKDYTIAHDIMKNSNCSGQGVLGCFFVIFRCEATKNNKKNTPKHSLGNYEKYLEVPCLDWIYPN
jgi:hypothetical protein